MPIRLLYSKEPVWVDIGSGAALLCEVPTTMRVWAARAKADRLLAELKDAALVITDAGGTITGAPDLTDADHEDAVRQALFVAALSEIVAVDWRGVLSDDAEGTPLGFDRAMLSELLSAEHASTLFLANYLRPITEVDDAKKD